MPNTSNIPVHIAIIMDGNGRWASQRHLPRSAGHREGAKRIREIAKSCADLGVKYLTLFAFSTENWQRSKNEINALMRLLDHFLSREIKELQKNNIRFIRIGREDPIPAALLKKIASAEESTRGNSTMTLVLAINYGSRQEILDAARHFAEDVQNGKKQAEDLNEEIFSGYLCTAGIPDPDLLIRTSGEMRISNFLLWQASYAEFYFPKAYWPDFGREELLKAVREYASRQRRFGKADVN